MHMCVVIDWYYTAQVPYTLHDICLKDYSRACIYKVTNVMNNIDITQNSVRTVYEESVLHFLVDKSYAYYILNEICIFTCTDKYVIRRVYVIACELADQQSNTVILMELI